MGVVYRARDLRLDLDIALKRIRPDRFSAERRETLRRELLLSRRVTHENVCRVYDLVELDGDEFVSMEYLSGRTLKEIEDEERTLPVGRGLSIAKALCRGLAAAHRLGILHRDLKPENVILTEDGVPHLMDFGIAVESAFWAGEKEETVPGTPQFLAPELLRGEPPSIRTDVYAMGVLLYEMFTGRVPFDDADTARLVRMVISEEAPRAVALRPDLPPELHDILDRAIAKDPLARFPSSDDLADAIAAFEGQFLDRVLAEVSVTRARMVKLMVILEANKSLKSTFDPTETLRIILATATSETDAERGTIFLRDGEELVSQILEGGAVAPIRLPMGKGLAGTAASTGRVINTSDVYRDPRFDKRVDASSGFKTQSILAAPMRNPKGEIVGVVEILNKRRGRPFTKEDEEFLSEVASHAALAVESVRDHERAVAIARAEGAAEVVRSAAALLTPGAWPETPGFESAPLRWSAGESTLASFAVDAAPGRLAFLLLEREGIAAEAFGPLARACQAARSLASVTGPRELCAEIARREASVSAAAIRWEDSRLTLAATGASLLPWVMRRGVPVPFLEQTSGSLRAAVLDPEPGDLLLLASRGLSTLSGAGGKPVAPGEAVLRLARAAAEKALPVAFAEVVAEMKRLGVSPGPEGVLLLAARGRP
jgi:putative methionine-R-sulfoxide reductase with GAF domain